MDLFVHIFSLTGMRELRDLQFTDDLDNLAISEPKAKGKKKKKQNRTSTTALVEKEKLTDPKCIYFGY